ncbi:hypothetical protein [Ensifer adhaerens]|uniref:hypothetical protein n=1 Tax=Ensifer adhaerens TaxID=106592 RepID=UPI00159EB958|nr:hypothetical protein [Ensifer adhaerens]
MSDLSRSETDALPIREPWDRTTAKRRYFVRRSARLQDAQRAFLRGDRFWKNGLPV